ncbi:PHP-associated domain-containing protein [Halorientalis halophila]|uniref:PHP-associated domain-containing protein n=1 Tax=Halorientalis halophila TaxID=3108499 RepID=UPI00300A5CE5
MAGGASDDGFRVDMHVKILDDEVVRRAKARGLDALVYAPHFTRLPDIREAAARYSDDELLVVPARELFTGDWRSRRHVLAVGLSDPVPDFLTLEGTMAELRRQNAAVLVPHPEFLTVSLDIEQIREYREQIDAVEVYNPKHWKRDNRRALEIARDTGLPTFASSYAHLPKTVGEVWTSFREPMESTEDLVTALQAGAPRRIFHREGLDHRLRKTAEFAHLFWENTYKKFDRIYLQGTEPTHPGHIFYRDEFDDVRLY